MKKMMFLVVCFSVLMSGYAHAKDYFFYNWACYKDGGSEGYTGYEHEAFTTYMPAQKYGSGLATYVQCDKVCVMLLGNYDHALTNVKMTRYGGTFTGGTSNISWSVMSNYVGEDSKESINTIAGTATRYCFDQKWKDGYVWASDGTSARKTVFSFTDHSGASHALTVVPTTGNYFIVVK